jgi:hypothetical protein
MIRSFGFLFVVACLLSRITSSAADSLPEQTASTLKRLVEFYHDKVAEHGGYVYRYSEDLAKREGEGKIETHCILVPSMLLTESACPRPQ